MAEPYQERRIELHRSPQHLPRTDANPRVPIPHLPYNDLLRNLQELMTELRATKDRLLRCSHALDDSQARLYQERLAGHAKCEAIYLEMCRFVNGSNAVIHDLRHMREVEQAYSLNLSKALEEERKNIIVQDKRLQSEHLDHLAQREEFELEKMEHAATKNELEEMSTIYADTVAILDEECVQHEELAAQYDQMEQRHQEALQNVGQYAIDHADIMAELQGANQYGLEQAERADNFRTAFFQSHEKERLLKIQLQEQTEAFEEERIGYQLQMDRQDTDMLEALESGHRLQVRLELLDMKNANEGDERHVIKAEGDRKDEHKTKRRRKGRSRMN